MEFESLEKAICHSNKFHTEKPILLVGNGFSRECCRANDISDAFSYTRLFDLVKDHPIEGTERKISDLFERLNTVDFEYVLNILYQAKIHQSLIEIFSSKDEIAGKMENQIKNIKILLADALLNIHPIHQYEAISERSYAECTKFLKKFSHIYSLNYDLLLYWAHMNAPNLKSYLKDGFFE